MKQDSRGFSDLAALPEIRLSAEPPTAEPGEPVRLEWEVSEAGRASLWTSASLPWAPQVLNWTHVAESGEPVPLKGATERAFDTTNAIYLVALRENGWTGTYVKVEVGQVDQIRAEPHAWGPRPEVYPLMQEGPNSTWRIHRVAAPSEVEFVYRPIAAKSWGAGTPGLTISVTPDAIFTDGQSPLTWSVTNASGATRSMGLHTTSLVPGSVCGTKYGGAKWGAGGTPVCGGSMAGTWQISGQAYGHCRQDHFIQACIVPPPAVPPVAGCSLDILGVPQFKGNATANRKTDIRAAVIVVDRELRKGAIRDNTGLDSSVDAFKTGRINRQQFWFRLMDELENLNLDTFVCADVTDADWGGGHWSDYSNEIILDWSPSYTPWLELVITHELIHKCGFNSILLKWYSVYDIEKMTEILSQSVI